jgi:hypothetical protein
MQSFSSVAHDEYKVNSSRTIRLSLKSFERLTTTGIQARILPETLDNGNSMTFYGSAEKGGTK